MSSRLIALRISKNAGFKIDIKQVLYQSTLKIGLLIVVFVLSLLWIPTAEGESRDTKEKLATFQVPILLYHRFSPVISDSMM